MTQRIASRGVSRDVVAFVGLAYGLSMALSLTVGLTGGHQSQLAFGFGVVSMFIYDRVPHSDGKRCVVYTDTNVELLGEEEFQKQYKKYFGSKK